MTWPLYPLSQVASINPRFEAGKIEKEATISFVPMAAVSEVTGAVIREEERLLADVIKGFTPFLNGDILVAKITPCFENGKIALAQLSRDVGFGSTEFHVVRPLPHLLDTRYAYHFLRQPAVRQQGERRMTGSAGQRRVPKDFIEGLNIPLPSLTEQRRIAALLDEADALRHKRREVITKLDSLLQSVFLDMFGDPVTNPKSWSRRPISAFGNVVTGNTPSREQSNFYGGKLEWIKSDNINTSFHFLTTAQEYISDAGRKVSRVVPAESILVSCIAGSPDCIGNAAIANREVAFNQQINAITPYEKVDTYFLYVQLLVAKRLVQNASTNSMKGMVSKSAFSAIELIYPNRTLIQSFADMFSQIHSQLAANRDILRKLDALFSAFQQTAFSNQTGDAEQTYTLTS